MAQDPFDLDRFVTAQDTRGTFGNARAELRNGDKETHWMWFVFPQLAGLGHSSTARTYAISSLDEARAYLADPVLGSRLRECAQIVADLRGLTAVAIFGGTDAVKLRSSMTLFLRAAPSEPLWQSVLDRYFDGAPDPRTEQLLR